MRNFEYRLKILCANKFEYQLKNSHKKKTGKSRSLVNLSFAYYSQGRLCRLANINITAEGILIE